MDKSLIKFRVGRLIHNIPYSSIPRIGHVYKNYKNEIAKYKDYNIQEEQKAIFEKVHKLVAYAIENIPFYRDYYSQKGFSINQLRSYDDISLIPIVSKKELMAVPLEYRSVKQRMSFLTNTGGSTGIPLSFYKLREQQIKETAYYDEAWSKLGYSNTSLRLQFVGRSQKEIISYDLIRKRLTANIYTPFEQLIKKLSEFCNYKEISYLQGYPSVLYQFALFMESHPEDYMLSGLNGKIKGIFLNSEYPYPEYRKKIEKVFDAKCIASYGHTEGCILAFDYGDNTYDVMRSYGYAEAIEMPEGKHLIGTSYDSFGSPFIRYDTGDIVDNAVVKEGLLYSFRMSEGGRSGQYVIDKKGVKISLTGLIFGRHHRLFDYCSQIQLSQIKPGYAKVFYVPNETVSVIPSPAELFNSDEIDMCFEFEQISSPIRTKSGKVLLLIKN